MSFRFRVGPFTFGRSGARLSLWGAGSGVSIPLTGKGRSFGKVGIGPVSWYLSGAAYESSDEHGHEAKVSEQCKLNSHEQMAIDSLRALTHTNFYSF